MRIPLKRRVGGVLLRAYVVCVRDWEPVLGGVLAGFLIVPAPALPLVALLVLRADESLMAPVAWACGAVLFAVSVVSGALVKRAMREAPLRLSIVTAAFSTVTIIWMRGMADTLRESLIEEGVLRPSPLTFYWAVWVLLAAYVFKPAWDRAVELVDRRFEGRGDLAAQKTLD